MATAAKSPAIPSVVAVKGKASEKPSKEISAPLVVTAPSNPPLDPVTVPELAEPTTPLSSFVPVSPDGKILARTDRVGPKRNREQPILVAPAGLPAVPSNAVSVGHDSASVSDAHSTVSWRTWLMLAWSLGVSWYALRIVWQGAALGRRLRRAQPAESPIMQRVRDAATKMKLSRVPQVLILDAEISPFVCGMWRSKLVLPRAVTETFTPEQLDLVLLHELAHVLRRDLIWGWIPEIGRVLFFFHPVVHVMCNQIRFERELACDQLAMLSSGRDAATYADTLVRVVGQFSARESLKLVVTDSPQI